MIRGIITGHNVTVKKNFYLTHSITHHLCQQQTGEQHSGEHKNGRTMKECDHTKSMLDLYKKI